MEEDLVFKECNYRFKGKSCDECPLKCNNATKNDIYIQLKQYKASKQKSYEEMQIRWNNVEQENRELKKLLKESCNHYAPCGECSLNAHNCIGTAKCIDKLIQALKKIKTEIYTCDNCKEKCLNSDCDDCDYDFEGKIKNIIKDIEDGIL